VLNIPKKGKDAAVAKKSLTDKKIPDFLKPKSNVIAVEKKKDPRDTTVGIWDHVYKCSIPMLASRHIEDIKDSGVHLSGDPDMDADIKGRQFVCYINIDKMVEYYREGVPVRVLDRKDTREIYDAISKHIYAWMEQVKHGVNVGGTPIDDLILMDRFASSVYEFARHLFEQDDYATLLSRHFGMGTFKAAFSNESTSSFAQVENSGQVDTSMASSGIMMFRSKVPSAPSSDTIGDRESLGDFFKERRQYIQSR
jgi:hypothetical protein